MWRLAALSFLLLVPLAASARYLEFELKRVPARDGKHELQPVACKDEAHINQDAEYREVCYEKDIVYAVAFQREGRHIAVAADFTTPLSWLKGDQCTVIGSSEKCKLTVETFGEKVRDVKKKIASKFHKEDKAEKENAIIEGSSETIKGELEQCKSVSFITKDSSRLTNFLQIVMLGLFIHGEKDHLELDATNFISATAISPNLNTLSDGAISLRLDQSSENSFLDEIFAYIKSEEKIVSVYIGENRTLTIGDLTSKYTKDGFSSINWAAAEDEEGYGKLAQVAAVGVEDSGDDKNQELDETLPAIFTLSASYIGLPEDLLSSILSKFLGKQASCKIDATTAYAECSSSNKKNLEKLLSKHLYFTLSGGNLMLPLKDLVLSNSGKRVVLNLKKAFNQRVIFGEPVFKKYTLFLDYSKNRIGYALKRESLSEFLNVVLLVRFICSIFLFGCTLLLCYKPCQKFIQELRGRFAKEEGGEGEGRQLRQYAPVQENPYEQLRGKMQEAFSSTDRQFDS